MTYETHPQPWRRTPWLLRLLGWPSQRRLILVTPITAEPLDHWEYSDD